MLNINNLFGKKTPEEQDKKTNPQTSTPVVGSSQATTPPEEETTQLTNNAEPTETGGIAQETNSSKMSFDLQKELESQLETGQEQPLYIETDKDIQKSLLEETECIGCYNDRARKENDSYTYDDVANPSSCNNENLAQTPLYNTPAQQDNQSSLSQESYLSPSSVYQQENPAPTSLPLYGTQGEGDFPMNYTPKTQEPQQNTTTTPTDEELIAKAQQVRQHVEELQTILSALYADIAREWASLNTKIEQARKLDQEINSYLSPVQGVIQNFPKFTSPIG